MPESSQALPESIVVTSTSFQADPFLMKQLELVADNYGVVVRRGPGSKLSSEDELIKFVGASSLAIIGGEEWSGRVISAMPNPKVLIKYGVGLDNVDQVALARAGGVLLHQPGVNSSYVAEFTIGLMLSLLRNISLCSRLLHQLQWCKSGGTSLLGCTVGVLGVGHVGLKVARLAGLMGCKVLGSDIRDVSQSLEALGSQQVSKSQLMAEADILTIHVPLNDQTRGLIGQNEIESMRSGAFLINTARGHLVDEEVLYQALVSGHLGGAAFDVFACEPYSGALLQLDQFIATPHIAANSRQAVHAMGMAAVDLLRGWLSGQK